MRLREFNDDRNSVDELTAHLLTVLEFLRNRAHNRKLIPSIDTPGFINMVNNVYGAQELTYDTLKPIVDDNPAVQNLIKDMDREHIHLKPFGDEPGAEQEEPESTGDGKSKDPTRTVDAMAKRAANKRS